MARERLDVGTVIAFVACLTRLYGALTGISNIHVSLMTALVSFERVFEVLDVPCVIQDAAHAIDVPTGPVRVSFDRVTFRYPSSSEISLNSLESIAVTEKTTGETVLHCMSLAIEPGQMVALVGPSGAGKTTVTHLVARLYEVQSGSVSINGIDVRNLTLDSIYQHLGSVMQDPYLFHDTIRGNLLYAKPDAIETI